MSTIALSPGSTGAAQFTIASPTTNTNRTITLPDATTTLVGTDATQTLTNKTLTAASLSLASAALSGTAVAGNVEYNGAAAFFTPTGTQRGVMPSQQFYRLNAGLVGANSTSAQSLLGVGVTLSASTIYAFELGYYMIKTAGTTTHSVSISFGGTATLNNIFYTGPTAQGAGTANTISTIVPSVMGATVATSVAISNQSYSAATNVISSIYHGTVSIDAGGTFIPQYTLSAAPGGAYTTAAGSYMLIYPLAASGAAVNIGTWA